MTLWSHSSPSAAPSVLREPVVYVVDDDASMRQALDGLLRSIGLRVELFGSVAEFMNFTRPDLPSCLVLDVRLQGTSGLDFQNELLMANINLPDGCALHRAAQLLKTKQRILPVLR